METGCKSPVSQLLGLAEEFACNKGSDIRSQLCAGAPLPMIRPVTEANCPSPKQTARHRNKLEGTRYSTPSASIRRVTSVTTSALPSASTNRSKISRNGQPFSLLGRLPPDLTQEFPGETITHNVFLQMGRPELWIRRVSPQTVETSTMRRCEPPRVLRSDVPPVLWSWDI